MAAIAQPTPQGRDAAVLNAPRSIVTLDGLLQQFILRAGFVATGAFVFSTAVQVWNGGAVDGHHEVVWLVFAQYAVAFGLMIIATLDARRLQCAALLIPLATIFALMSWFYVQMELRPRIYTDSAAFLRVAAARTLDGENPYEISGRGVAEAAADEVNLPRTLLTSTTDGTPQLHLVPYPGGALLTALPGVAVGIDDVRWLAIICEIATVLLLWRVAPIALKPLSIVPLLVDPQLALHYSGGGVMDFVWVLPLTACAVALYRGKLSWSALLFGLACGIKQQPWLLAPFFAVWVWNVDDSLALLRRSRAVAAFGLIAFASFMATNLPFIVWGPGAWWESVLTPFSEQLVPLGSGLSLLTQTGMVDLPKSFYSVASMGVLGVLLLAYAVHFRSLKHGIWVASAIVMWFGYRSLQNYFIFWTPMILVAIFAWWDQAHAAANDASTAADADVARPALALVPDAPHQDRYWPLFRTLSVPIAVVALVGGLVGVGMQGTAAESLQVDMTVAASTDPAGIGATTQATVELANDGDKEMHPRFSVSWVPYPHYWKVTSGPAFLAPGEHATYEITAPDLASAPPDGETFSIKVNDAASIVYHVSPPITKTKPDLPIVNPAFALWSIQSAAGRELPAAWTLFEGLGSGDRADVERVDAFGVSALRLHLVQDGQQDPGSWAHTGLAQQIAFPELPFEVTALSHAAFRTDAGNNPTNAFGIEVSDPANGTIWVLFQQTGTGDREYDLSAAHHIKVFDIPAAQWAKRVIDLPAMFHALNWAPSDTIALRVIAAAASTSPQEVDGYIARLKTVSQQ